MLRELGIKNFVLMEKARIEFEAGLNVLTGETGAGKSIVLDALGFLLGERFKSDAVRQGAERAEVDGLFDAPKIAAFRSWWDAHGFEKTDEILLRREGSPDGRSRAFLNDRVVSAATLEELREFLMDVHGQNEHQQILKPSVQQALLDQFGGLEEAAAAIAPLFQSWRQAMEALNAGVLSEQERMQRIDLFSFQLKEIEQAHLKPGEEDELAARLPELKNAEKLRSLAQEAYGTLYEQEGSVLEKLGQVERTFQALCALAPAVEPLSQEIQTARAQLDDAARNLQTMAERWEVDPQALESALTRLDQLHRLKKKYGNSVDEMLAYAQKLRGDLDQLEHVEAYRRELETRSEQSRRALERACRELSTQRKAAAKQLSQAIRKPLNDLGLAQAVFQCTVDSSAKPAETDFSSTGIDRISFVWAPNPGEGIRPLKDIVSGGEMSRVMLALKTVLAQADRVPVLAFDEVDAGVSGVTAQAVGQKLRALSRHHQILCVSHLPQIAACAHAHFHVSKRVVQSRTVAHITRLESSERLDELARLLGSQVTPTSLQHAKELLAQNQ